MNIMVCCKFIPSLDDMETAANCAVSFSRAQWQISEYDLQAIEEGSKLAKATGGKLFAVSVGETKINDGQLRKDLLSRGPDELYLVADDTLAKADTAAVSGMLAQIAQKLDVQLVLCGEGSADFYYQQTGLQIGEKLGWANLSNINKIVADGDTLTVDRVLDDITETIELNLPAVLSVTSSINKPGRPNMRAILGAGKKPVSVWTAADVNVEANTVETISTLAPESVERKQIVLEGTPEEIAVALIRSLKGEGVI